MIEKLVCPLTNDILFYKIHFGTLMRFIRNGDPHNFLPDNKQVYKKDESGKVKVYVNHVDVKYEVSDNRENKLDDGSILIPFNGHKEICFHRKMQDGTYEQRYYGWNLDLSEKLVEQAFDIWISLANYAGENQNRTDSQYIQINRSVDQALRIVFTQEFLQVNEKPEIIKVFEDFLSYVFIQFGFTDSDFLYSSVKFEDRIKNFCEYLTQHTRIFGNKNKNKKIEDILHLCRIARNSYSHGSHSIEKQYDRVSSLTFPI